MKKNPSKPCNECAFRRDSEPGFLGGSPPEMFLGQSVGPFVVPCHCHCDFDDPTWKDKIGQTPQCAGLAIYRANIDSARFLPDALHKLPADHDLVFSTPAEFLAHHKQITLAEAEAQMLKHPVGELFLQELMKSEVRQYDVNTN